MPVDDASFRRIALALPEVAEGTHQGLPTFHVRGKRFATLGWPHAGAAAVTLPAEVRDILVDAGLLAPMPGGWGAKGHVYLRLDLADEPAVAGALLAAWRKAAPKALAKSL